MGAPDWLVTFAPEVFKVTLSNKAVPLVSAVNVNAPLVISLTVIPVPPITLAIPGSFAVASLAANRFAKNAAGFTDFLKLSNSVSLKMRLAILSPCLSP